MANTHEPAKILLPYLQRADELQKHEPLVAYYCRLYAMDCGMKIPAGERTKTTNSLLKSLMAQLERDQKSLKPGPEDNLHLEGFALSILQRQIDKIGLGELTSKTFYAASIFFEILKQFGPLQHDLEQKQKYAAWKAADIRKALKEGRKPVPGPPSTEDDLPLPPSTPSMSQDHVMNQRKEVDPSPWPHERIDCQHSADFLGSPPRHPFSGYTQDFHAPRPPNTKPESPPHLPSSTYTPQNHHTSHSPPYTRAESSTFSSYHQETPQQQHISQNYPSEQRYQPHDYSSEQYPQAPQVPHNYSSDIYPHFQTYPSFTETSLSSQPSHYPSSYYQGHEASDVQSKQTYASVPHYGSSSSSVRANVCVSSESPPTPTPAQAYQYDSNYQPPPEKIAEAHKAARFAVGALASGDVFIAVDFLKKSLELLTNPSAGQ